MSQFCFRNAKTPHFSIGLLILLLSFIISHPLYFLYFVFFSPYIFKLLSFLSPLFITTFLLVLALLTLSPALLLSPDSSSDSKLGSLFQKCGAVLDKLLRPTVSDGQNEDSRCFEELEAYKIVFEAVTFDEVRDEEEMEEKHCLPDFEKVGEEEKRVGMGKGDEEEVVEKVKEAVGGAESEKVVGEQEELMETAAAVVVVVGASEEGMGSHISDNGGGEGEWRTSKGEGEGEGEGDRSVVESSEGDQCYYSPRKDMERSENLGSFGSMRKEKEWRRTLACKLFEERHNVEGGEGMDSLWETYESDSSKGKKMSKKKKSEDEEDEEEEEEDEEGMDRQLCCLQALKFSAGKMNLGMGRPNLVKISKAFKGLGWLHQQVSKHGRKAHRRD